MIRRAYGWTDEQIIEHIEYYGVEWLNDTCKLILEDEYADRMYLLAIAPLARTPMTEKGARALNKYQKQIERQLSSQVWWVRRRERLGNLRGRLKSGEVKVFIDDPAERGSDLFEGVDIEHGG